MSITPALNSSIAAVCRLLCSVRLWLLLGFVAAALLPLLIHTPRLYALERELVALSDQLFEQQPEQTSLQVLALEPEQLEQLYYYPGKAAFFDYWIDVLGAHPQQILQLTRQPNWHASSGVDAQARRERLYQWYNSAQVLRRDAQVKFQQVGTLYPAWWPQALREHVNSEQLSPALELFSGARNSIEWLSGGRLLLEPPLALSSKADFVVLRPFSGRIFQPLDLLDPQVVESFQRAERIVLGDNRGGALVDLAAQLQALERGDYAYRPWWQPLLSLPLAILVWLLLLLVCRYRSPLFSFLTMLVVQLSLVAAALLLLQQQWLFGVAPLLAMTLLGYMVAEAWALRQKQLHQLQRSCSEAQLQLATQLSASEAWEALRQLAQTAQLVRRDHDEFCAQLYRAAQTQIEQEQFASARLMLQSLQQHRKRYRDVTAILKNLPEQNRSSPQDGRMKVEELDEVDLAATVPLEKPALIKKVFGRYRVEKELGRGAMGVVYLGRDPKIARRVAIKTLNYDNFNPSQRDELRERFFREAEAAGRLRHPNIVTVYDVGEEGGLAFIAMDYIEGAALSAYTHSEKLLPVKVVYEIIAAVADALDYAHSQQVVHRDIKPDNMLYNEATGLVAVTDFGIARLSDESRTKTGELLGSPLYMAPEQLKGKANTPSVDIFALGVSFYQLLCGELPFSGESLAQLTYAIIHDKHRPVREVRAQLPASASRIINKALQKDPDKRYSSAQEMAQALRNSLMRDFKTSKQRR